jgi:hypothetical protein
MSVIYGILALVWGGYTVQPQMFDNGPYEFNQKYETLAECKIAKSETDICVGEQPSNLYVLSEKKTPSVSAELDFVECDYWAGCYIQE